MKKELEEIFEKTFEDKKFSGSEKKAIKQIFIESGANKQTLDYLRNYIFKIAGNELKGPTADSVLDWLENANKVLVPMGGEAHKTSVYFSPGTDCLNAILTQLQTAGKSIDICIFTLSDDRIAKGILDAKKRGVNIRIITDNDKMFDKGSDIFELNSSGVEVKVDMTSDHMHHKFALIDNKTVITGSYNWTRSAARNNFENILITDDPSPIHRYAQEFEKLWGKMKRVS